MIPYGRQHITNEDIEAVVEVLKSDYLTQGPVVPEFESQLAMKIGARFGVATNSATSALHLACLALGLKAGDYLWTSPITFVASSNAALYCGAKVDFVDIDNKTYNLCPVKLRQKLQQAEKVGKLPKIVMPVHLAGQSCDMAAIWQLSEEYGFRIIEDASHAIGGKYQGHYIGNCRYSDITVFSFHPVKIITTAEGGMATTQSEELADTMALLRSHGITRDEQKMTSSSHGPWYYQQIGLGFNYRMTELQAALGVTQLTQLDNFVHRRHELAIQYEQLLSSLPLTTPWQHPDCYSALHLYIVRLRFNQVKCSHGEVFGSLRKQGIGVNLHYIPVHTQPYYQEMGFRQKDYPEAMAYYSEAISLPMYFDLSDADQVSVVSALARSLDEPRGMP